MKRFTNLIDPLPSNKFAKFSFDQQEIHSAATFRASTDLTFNKRGSNTNTNQFSPEGSPKSTKKFIPNSPPSPFRHNQARSSLMSSNSFSLNKKKNSEDSSHIVSMMKKSIMEINKTGDLLGKMQFLHKEELIKSLLSEKFSFSQALEVAAIILQKPSVKRNKNDINILKYCMQNIKFFQEQKKDAENILEKCCKVMKYKFCKKNDIVFLEGSRGSLFYIIISGKVGICKFVDKSERNDFFEKNDKEFMLFDDKSQKNYCFYELKTIKTGDSFGQLALMENKPRSASIICKEDCHFAVLDKEHFDGILKELERNNLAEDINFFAQRPIFKDMSLNSLKTLFLNCDVCDYRKLQYVYREGEKAESFFIIKSGEFEITKKLKFKTPSDLSKPEFFTRKKTQDMELFESEILLLSKDNFFGNEELECQIPRKYNMRCISSEGTLYQIYANDFHKLILPNNENQQFFHEHSKEMNKYIEERIEIFERKKQKDILKKFKKQEKEYSITQQKNNDLELDFAEDEVKLFFSDAILKTKEQHIDKIFAKDNEMKNLGTIPKLFEHSLKENSRLFKNGLISQMKIQKKQTLSFIRQFSMKDIKSPKKKTETPDLENLPRNNSQPFLFPNKFSISKTDRNNNFQGYFIRKGLNSSTSRSKCSKDKNFSELIVSNSKSFQKIRKNNEAKVKLENMLNHNENKNKEFIQEEYGFKDFLPLKYQAKSIRNKNKSFKNLTNYSFFKKNMEE